MDDITSQPDNNQCFPSHGTRAVILHVHKEEEPRFGDILEIGTPGKGGLLKVRFNADNPEEGMRRVENAFRVRAYAQELGTNPPKSPGV